MSEFVSPRMRLGMTRLYIAVVIPWVLGFGFLAWYEHRVAEWAERQVPEWESIVKEDDRRASERRAEADELGLSGEKRRKFLRQIEMDSEVARVFYKVSREERDHAIRLRNAALYALPIVPIGAPILWMILLMGFGRLQKNP